MTLHAHFSVGQITDLFTTSHQYIQGQLQSKVML
uniref:Uncharacterized protein n=1 Tax=Anguilla anguilla TaxID=7936 RepID=A0A0E9R7X5_ANGAN